MGTAIDFIDMVKAAISAAKSLGLGAAAFQTLPAGTPRALRRREGAVTALIDSHRAAELVAVDIADALVAANRLEGAEAERARTVILGAIASHQLHNDVLSDDDLAHLRRSYQVAATSQDPRTQNGAVLVARDGRTAEAPNHLAPTITPRPERWHPDTKAEYVIHAETGAILAAAKTGVMTEGATLYVPWYACLGCARDIIGAGIARVVGHQTVSAHARRTSPAWNDGIDKALNLLQEAGVNCVWHHGVVDGAPVLRVGGVEFDPGEAPSPF